jgi:hypothetical protein
MGNALLAAMRRTSTVNDTPLEPEETANNVVHPVTKATITKYKQLIDDSVMREVWANTMYKELWRLTQRCTMNYHIERTYTMRFLDHEEFGKIPCERVVTYVQIVVDY